MKTLTLVFIAWAAALNATPALYEGFDTAARSVPLGTPEARIGESSRGWLSHWDQKEGKSRILNEDLQLTGLASAPGLVSSRGKTVARRQLAETFKGDAFGSFRIRGVPLKDNSMMGLLFSLPDADPVNPKTSLLSILGTRWGSELGGIVLGGRPVPIENGAAINAGETALILWKITDLPEPGKKSDQTIQVWILNEAQAAHFAALGMPEKALNRAKSGRQADEVLQSLKVPTRGSKFTLVKGLVISCFSADVPKADFDEIRISSVSLADAAGVSEASRGIESVKEYRTAPRLSSFMPADANRAKLAGPGATVVEDRKAPSPDSPDIIFVLLDDLRWDTLGYMDHPFVETPNIDRLRDQGALMQNAFVTTSICCPSRATFLTGTLASRHGVIDNETSEYNPDVTPPLTLYLQEAGYRTAMVGKWHMGNSGAPRAYFDFWLSFKGQGVYHDPLFNINGEDVPHQGYTTDLITDYAIDFIQRQPTDQPYFCMVSHKAVHEPFQPAPRHRTAFGKGTTTAEPASWSEDFADKPDWLKRQALQDVRWHYRTRDFENESLPAWVPLEPWKETSKYVDQLRCLAAVDDGIGRILEALEARGTLDRTLIIFTSDNGYFHLEHRRWDKRLAYEESLRIPMLVVYPGRIAAGSTVPQLVTNADFAPTVLSYAGLDVPDLMQGRNMRPLFEERDPEWRDAVFYEYWKELVHAIPTMTAIRTARHKLITFPELDDIDELYDLEKDPHEMNNLAMDPAYADLLKEMVDDLSQAKVEYGWQQEVFPKNLPRVRGPSGVLLDLAIEQGALIDRAGSGLQLNKRALQISRDEALFDGHDSAIEIPFSQLTDPTGWPFVIDVVVRPESDGIIAVQSTPGYGFKLFVQDGRPGVSVHCKTWIDTSTTIDGPVPILGEWTQLRVRIDYNQLQLLVNGVEAESVSLPLPFKGSPKTPLIIGNRGSDPVAAGLPENPFAGALQRFTLQRGLAQ